MFDINSIFELVNTVSNKEQRGSITPARFNLLAKTAQTEVISELLGNNQNLNERGVPPYGYGSNRRVNESIRPLVYGPIDIVIRSNGDFDYPYGYIWPDSVSKTDFTPFAAILEADQYPRIKHSTIKPPTLDYPVMVFRNPYGFIDPYSIGAFKMSYVKRPPDPVWAYDVVNDVPVYNSGTSVQFTVNDVFCLTRIAMKILQYVGVNLDAAQVTQLATLKQEQGT